MARPSIGVATCAAAPDLDEDGTLLLEALSDAGASARPGVWDDDRVDWRGFDLVLVRSTWDYPRRLDSFLAWLRGCRALANPMSVLAWNTDKRYLADLTERGVPTVPTTYLPPGAALPTIVGGVVVKPAVSGSAADTGRFASLQDDGARSLVDRLHAAGRTVMVQPYLDAIETEGETSLVFLGGVFSHAVRREPLLSEPGERRPVVVADVLSTVRPVTATSAQLAAASSALEVVPGGRAQLSYARVDLVETAGGPAVLELEATDCFLFLAFAAPQARARMADHVVGSTR